MKNFIQINGKKIEISEETAENLKKQFSQKEIPSDNVAIGSYEFSCDIDWVNKEEILIKDKPKQKIFVNQKFANNSEFGNSCVFIKCKFGSYCEFGSGCKFGSDCKFGSSCEFGSDCKFGNSCEFGSDCKKQRPYWDEDGKHE